MSNKSRILIISPKSIPFHFGGMERVTWELAKAYKSLGHEITVLCAGNKYQEQIHDGIKFLFFKENVKLFIFRWITSLLNQNKILKSINAIHNFDLLLFTHSNSVLGALSVLSKIPHVYLFLSPLPEEARLIYKNTKNPILFAWRFFYFLFSFFAEKIAISKVQNISSLSTFMIEEAHKLVPNKKFHLIPGGVDTIKFSPSTQTKEFIREELGLPKNKQIVFCVRRMVPRMGIQFLLESICLNKNLFFNTIFVIGGAGPELTKYNNYIQENNLNALVRFAGFIDEQSLLKYYQCADLYVQPSIALEGFGLTVLEAMACGTPVLTTSIGGTPEVISKFEEQLVCKDKDPKDFGAYLHSVLIKIVSDPTYRQRVRLFIEKYYSWEIMANNLLPFSKKS